MNLTKPLRKSDFIAYKTKIEGNNDSATITGRSPSLSLTFVAGLVRKGVGELSHVERANCYLNVSVRHNGSDEPVVEFVTQDADRLVNIDLRDKLDDLWLSGELLAYFNAQIKQSPSLMCVHEASDRRDHRERAAQAHG